MHRICAALAHWHLAAFNNRDTARPIKKQRPSPPPKTTRRCERPASFSPSSWEERFGQRINESQKVVYAAHRQAASMQFNECIATLDEALSQPHCLFYASCQAVRSYALFRLGKDTEAEEAALDAVNKGAKSRFSHALAAGDVRTRAELRRIYPVVPAQLSAIISQEE